MIADHELVTAAIQGFKGFAEHSPGIASFVALVLYILLRDGIPYYRRRRNGGHNPGNHLLAERVLACEAACTRSETRWEAQLNFNKRMEKHVEKIYERIDKVAGG